jgi:hypothetical protein
VTYNRTEWKELKKEEEEEEEDRLKKVNQSAPERGCLSKK